MNPDVVSGAMHDVAQQCEPDSVPDWTVPLSPDELVWAYFMDLALAFDGY